MKVRKPICAIFGIMMVGISCVIAQGRNQQNHFSSDIQKVIDLIESKELVRPVASGEPEGIYRAKELLSSIPDARILSELRDVCADESLTGVARGVLLSHLILRGVARREDAFDVFFPCLEMAPSYSALFDLAGERGELVIAKVDALVRTSDTSKSAKQEWLRILASYGRRAQRSQDVVREILLDRNNDLGIRSEAAKALLFTAELDVVLPAFADFDEPVILMGPLVEYSVHTNGSFNTDQATRAKVRKFVVDALRHQDLEVRKNALIALVSVYAEDFAVQKEDGTYEVNPEVRAAFEYVIRNEPDARLREGAQKDYNNLDRRLERGLQKRQKRESAPK